MLLPSIATPNNGVNTDCPKLHSEERMTQYALFDKNRVIAEDLYNHRFTGPQAVVFP